MKTQNTVQERSPVEPTKTALYSIEFFHIYTDEIIGPVQTRSLEYFLAAKEAWNINASTVVLIDNYNPKHHILTPDDVFMFLEAEGCKPDYWAFEGDMIKNAEMLLESLVDAHLARNYRSYVLKHDKYPCSLLTASWYLTRIGALKSQGIIRPCQSEAVFEPAQYLINILPDFYKPIEKKAHQLIESSRYAYASNYIQALYYPIECDRQLDLF